MILVIELIGTMNSNPLFQNTFKQKEKEKRGEETRLRGEIVLDSLYGEYDRKFREIEAHSFPRGPLENGEGKVQHGQSARHIYASERGRESDLLGVARPTFETSHRWIESHFPPASSPSPSVSDSSPRRRETRLSPTSHEPPSPSRSWKTENGSI